jgi:hypothetical protein
VLQILGRDYAAYTPEAVARVCGCRPEDVVKVAELLCRNSGRERTSAVAYALGWTPDISRTLALIHSYLKPGGKLIFSWEHPVYQCLDYDPNSGKYFLNHSYLDENPERKPSWRGAEIILQPRKLSTYVNAICEAGLIIERLIESEPDLNLAREQDHAPEKWYSVPRAKLIPTTIIIKAAKPL